MPERKKLSREDAASLHLHLWLNALNRVLRTAVSRRGKSIAAVATNGAPARTLSHKHATHLIEGIETRVRDGIAPQPEIALERNEVAAEKETRRESQVVLPLDRLRRDAGLTDFEHAALLIIFAPEVAADYGQLYGFVVDDLARSHASIELILELTRGKGAHDGVRRRSLGPGGTLRRLGLVVADDPFANALATRLEPCPGLVEWLLGACVAPPVPLSDPRMIWPSQVPATNEVPALAAAVQCLTTAANGAVGLWGPEPGRHDDAVAALARATGRPVFRAAPGGEDANWQKALREQAAIASGAGAVLWLETRALPVLGTHGQELAAILTGLPQRMVLTGRIPWRDAGFIGSRPYADILLPDPASTAEWPLPPEVLSSETAAELDLRYRLGFRERRAAVQVALSEQRNRSNGSVPALGPALARAARLVATPAHLPSVLLLEPRRCLDELILPEELHRQIAEIATLYIHARKVDGAWGFGHITGSSGSLKALFTGDSGTGKTMAAEVIAGEAGVTLMKVDLSQVVSKWVGETEKNLEAVFDHAEQSHAVLFFDEAEALFGKRGEVRHGTDRYANLEVSYLLQRLETFSGGLVILSSNLRDEIDPAFSRRFQIALNFPRPGLEERLQLWETAFAKAPLDASVDLATLARYDLTGGAIMTSARMAALLAAGEGAQSIGSAHLHAATERQFRKEARLMGAGQPDGLSVARSRN